MGIINAYYACNLGAAPVPFSAAAVGRASYANVGQALAYFSASANLAGKLYVFGGFTGAVDTANCRDYDPVTDTWASNAVLPGGAQRLLAAAYGGNGFHRIGGITATTRHDRYDDGPNTWATGLSMVTLGSTSSGALVYANNGLLYYVGGTDQNGIYSYDPLNNAAGWTQRLDGPRNRPFCSASVIGDKIYVIGHNSLLIDIYDTVANTWSTGASPAATTINYPYSASANGYFYRFGAGTNPAQRYDPVGNVWVTLPSPPTVVSQQAVQHVGGGLILMAGGINSVAATVQVTQGYIDFQGSLITAPFNGACAGTDVVTNITAATSGATVAFSLGDKLGFRVNAWNTVAAAKSTTLVPA